MFENVNNTAKLTLQQKSLPYNKIWWSWYK